MSWRWMALREDRPQAVEAAVAVWTADGQPAGFLAVWPQGAKRPRQGRRIDARAIDVSGEAAWVSLVLAPEGVSLDFDDPAVVQATQRVLAQPWSAAVLSTLVVDRMRFGGAVTAVRDDPRRLADDPFARLFPARSSGSRRGCLARSLRPWARARSGTGRQPLALGRFGSA